MTKSSGLYISHRLTLSLAKSHDRETYTGKHNPPSPETVRRPISDPIRPSPPTRWHTRTTVSLGDPSTKPLPKRGAAPREPPWGAHGEQHGGHGYMDTVAALGPEPLSISATDARWTLMLLSAARECKPTVSRPPQTPPHPGLEGRRGAHPASPRSPGCCSPRRRWGFDLHRSTLPSSPACARRRPHSKGVRRGGARAKRG